MRDCVYFWFIRGAVYFLLVAEWETRQNGCGVGGVGDVGSSGIFAGLKCRKFVRFFLLETGIFCGGIFEGIFTKIFLGGRCAPRAIFMPVLIRRLNNPFGMVLA